MTHVCSDYTYAHDFSPKTHERCVILNLNTGLFWRKTAFPVGRAAAVRIPQASLLVRKRAEDAR